MKYYRFLVFGTSITWGAWDKEGGWVARIRQDFFHQSLENNLDDYHSIYNLGISGDTSEGVVRRVQHEIESRLEENTPLVVLLDVGVNDSAYDHESDEHLVSPDAYRKNLETIIKTAQQYADAVVIVGLTPVDDAKLDPVPWAVHLTYKNEFVKQYDTMAKEVAQQQSAGFIDVYKQFSSNADHRAMLFDGLHPDTSGHSLLYTIINDHLRNEKII